MSKSNIRKMLVDDMYAKAYATIQNDDMHKRFDEIRKFVLSDETLTENEKLETIKRFDNDYDYFRVIWGDGTRRTCENCNEKCIATSYCEYCIRNYLKSLKDWTSGNAIIDQLIQKCQDASLIPYMVVEWIPYNKFKNIDYLTKGGCCEIYSADWDDGYYKEWNSREMKLTRSGKCKVVLKRLENVEKANRSWLEEAMTHLQLSNKWGSIVQCYGISKDPESGKFILVMSHLDTDLRRYLLQNRNQITWKTKVKIIFEIIKALCRIHDEKSVHRDLHSGNVLFSKDRNDWYISDLGFCGPADKPLSSIYGNLPYIAPEILSKHEYTFKSDIYSVGILMWELSAEQPPFINFNHNYDLVMNVVKGMRPPIIPGTPSRFRKLMIECWDADPERRPDIKTLWDEVESINKSIHEDDNFWNSTSNSPINPNFNLNDFTSLPHSHSKLFNFSNLPQPKNASTDEQEEYYSKQIEFNIPDDI